MIGTVCPTWPCPYCVLSLRHTPTWQQVQECWECIESQAEEEGQNTFRYQMQRVAFEWLAEHFRTGHRLRTLERSAAGAATAASTSSGQLSSGRSTIPVCMQQASSSSAAAVPPQPLPPPPPPPSAGETSAPWTATDQERFSDLMNMTTGSDWPQFDWDNSSRNAKKRKWIRYDPGPEQAIRQAYLRGDTSVNITLDAEYEGQFRVYQYTIDLTPGAMTQTSNETGFVRKVQLRQA